MTTAFNFIYSADLKGVLTPFRGGSRDFENGGTLCRPPWLADEEHFWFQMV